MTTPTLPLAHRVGTLNRVLAAKARRDLSHDRYFWMAISLLFSVLAVDVALILVGFHLWGIA